MLGIGGNILQSSAAFSNSVQDISNLTHYFRAKTGVTTNSTPGVLTWQNQVGGGASLQADVNTDADSTVANRVPPYNATTGAMSWPTELSNSTTEDPAKVNSLVFPSTQIFTDAFSLFFVIDLNQFVGIGGVQADAYHQLTGSENNSFTFLFDNSADTSNNFFDMKISDGSAADDMTITALTNDQDANVKFLIAITKSAGADATTKVYINNNSAEISNTELTVDADFEINGIGGLRPQFGSTTGSGGGGIGAAIRHLHGNLYEWGAFDKEISAAEVTTIYNDINARGLIG